ncbi:hypothetical protein VSU19_03570 [Verrucomicrobiales bacterium BCK34]|nr:hypothetical protein [Verrucomicrobiales bacterium BCK34]
MKTISFILIFIFTTHLYSQDDTRLERLRTSWLAARERALKPIDETYKSELERLLETYTKAGRLEMALKVKGELESLDGGTRDLRIPEAPATSDDSLRHLIGPTWSDGDRVAFKFNSDGTGIKERREVNSTGSFQWVSIGDGIVEISFKASKLKQYFEATSSRQGYLYSSKERENKQSMTPE